MRRAPFPIPKVVIINFYRHQFRETTKKLMRQFEYQPPHMRGNTKMSSDCGYGKV